MQRSASTNFICAILAFVILTAAAPATAQATVELDKLLANDGNIADRFGTSVALDGTTAVIGAPDPLGDSSGAAYVFTFDGDAWNEQQKLVSGDAELRDDFGHSLAIDGDTIVVSALREDALGENVGAVYVFTRSGSTWSQQAKLLPDDDRISGGNGFGESVAIDGDTVVVGMRDGVNNGGTGAAYVFVRSGSAWSQQAILEADDVGLESRFGGSVSVSGDTVVVGSPDHQHSGTMQSSAYVYVRSGTAWSQQAEIFASDGVAGREFGLSVAVDGDTIVVADTLADGVMVDTGAAYVFVRDGAAWTEQAKLVAADGGSGNRIGESVALMIDTVIVGGAGFEAAYIFDRVGTGWSQRQKLEPSDPAAFRFGESVAVFGDTFLVGAPRADDLGNESGSAFVFGPEPPVPVLYGFEDFALATVDKTSGLLQTFSGLDVPGDPLPAGGYGLAVSPITNDMYGVVKLFNGSGVNRHLVRINPFTGIAMVIGSMEQEITSLAFDDGGVLYAVSDLCNVSCATALQETIFTVDLDDGSLSAFQTLGNGDVGEAIAFNPNDGFMYHLSGAGAGLVFEKINLTTGAVTPIALSGDAVLNRQAIDLAWDREQQLFVGSIADYDFDDGTLIALTVNGVLTDLGTLSRPWTNFAFLETGTVDSDFDGVPDLNDAFPDDPNESFDLDKDGTGDNADGCPVDPTGQVDSDGDGACDSNDDLPFDPNETVDTDGDGIGNNADVDDDNDGVADLADSWPLGRFNDVDPATHFAFFFIETLERSGVTGGCGNDNYCPNDPVTRAQMAVFLERGINGPFFVPPLSTGTVFSDVGQNDFAAAFIEQLAADGITGGCGGDNYCPSGPVTRAQMAVFLLRAKYGSGYRPPPATGVFNDVPVGSFGDGFIEQLAVEGITGGCGSGNYCPGDPITRAQMAVFLVRTFGL